MNHLNSEDYRVYSDLEIIEHRSELLNPLQETLKRANVLSEIGRAEIFFTLVQQLVDIRSQFFPEASKERPLSQWYVVEREGDGFVFPVQNYHSLIRGWNPQLPFQEECPWIYASVLKYFRKNWGDLCGNIDLREGSHRFVVIEKRGKFTDHEAELRRFKKAFKQISQFNFTQSSADQISQELSWTPFFRQNWPSGDEKGLGYIHKNFLYDFSFFNHLSGGYETKVMGVEFNGNRVGYLTYLIHRPSESIYWHQSYYHRTQTNKDLGLGNLMILGLLRQLYNEAGIKYLNLGLDMYPYKAFWSNQTQVILD